MIVLPKRGISRSIRVHNVKLDVFCDWIEACVLFLEEELSCIDVVDILIEEQRYTDQSFAREIVDAAWNEIERRADLCGASYGVSIDGRWARALGHWEDKPAHAFCLLLSLSSYYDWWHDEFGPDYTEQGELFELITDQALKALGQGWKTLRTGWGGASKRAFRDTVEDIANRINGGGLGNVDLWDTPNVKERGLDLIWYRPFPDLRVGAPYFLVQCASGANWEKQGKGRTPDLNVWENIINPKTSPMRGCAVPFSYSDERDFEQKCVVLKGIFIDRCRLLGASKHCEEWPAASLGGRLANWARPRIEKLIEKSY